MYKLTKRTYLRRIIILDGRSSSCQSFTSCRCYIISDDLVKSKLTYYRAMGNGHSWKLATVELWMFVRFRFHQSFSCVEKQSLDPFGLRNQQTCPYTNIQVLGLHNFDVLDLSTSYLKNSDIHSS